MGVRYKGVATSCDAAVRDPLLIIFLIVCLVTAVIAVRLLKAGRGQTHVGLQLSYLAAFWVNHWFAVPVYLIPGYCGFFPEFELPGARVSLYGLLGFAAGSIFLPKVFGWGPSRDTGDAPAVPSSLRYGLLALGGLFYVAMHTVSIKSVGAVFADGQQLMVAAVVLSIWEAARKRQSKTVVLWAVFSLLFPFATVVHSGFLGYGIASMAPVFIFATTCIGRRNYFRMSVFGVVGLYLGLSLYVNYMRDRGEIRASVWGGESFSDRVERFAQTFEHFEWFSPTNPNHLDAIAGRMNQNWLVGAGVVYIENTKEWARGDTLKYVALGFIPRVLWPGKPVAGGGDLVTRYTGLQFSAGTAVGIGQVLELYVNYGPWLVFFGFAALGGLFAFMDVSARNGLKTGAFNRFITCFIVALALENITNVFTAIVTSAMVGVMLTYGLEMFMRMKAKRAEPVLRPGVLRHYAG
jgi:hypothetical protein